MRAAVFCAALAACSRAALAAPIAEGFISDVPSNHVAGGDEYIVIFNSSHPAPPEAQEILNRISLSPEDNDVKYVFNNSAFGGFVANMKSHCIDALKAMGEVQHVEQAATIQSYTSQRPDTVWGLQAISNTAGAPGNEKAQTFTYSFNASNDGALGAGVEIYVVDTGVRTTHRAFNGRASSLWSFNSTDSSDGDGHGTHTAGTAAANTFGIASGANIFSVKVLGSDGSGPTSDTIAGMQQVIQRHNARKSQPGFAGSIMSMSWGLSGTSPSVETVIQAASNAGIHVAVAAGNSGHDACLDTPSHLGGAASNVVSVGSVDNSNSISTFSNTGSCVDVYAPGDSIISTWNTGDQTIQFLSGTSMACPHVTGVMAYLMVQQPALAGDPAAMKAKIRSLARSGLVKGNPVPGDPMLFLSNGINGAVSTKREAAVDGRGAVPAAWQGPDNGVPTQRY